MVSEAQRMDYVKGSATVGMCLVIFLVARGVDASLADRGHGVGVDFCPRIPAASAPLPCACCLPYSTTWRYSLNRSCRFRAKRFSSHSTATWTNEARAGDIIYDRIISSVFGPSHAERRRLLDLPFFRQFPEGY